MPRFKDPFEERPPRNEDEEREQKSWRERDAQKDRSSHVSPTAPNVPSAPPPRFEDRRAQNLAKQALNEFFQGKKSKVQEEAWKKVFEGSPKNFSKRASAYVDEHGLPREWDDLLRLLDHQETPFVTNVIDRMMEFAPKETAVRRDLLIGKLRVVKITAEDPKLIAKMDECIATLAGMA